MNSRDYFVKDLKIANDSYYFDTSGEDRSYLKDLKKVNIFVGENNSGKSRLLRTIIKNDLSYIPPYDLDLVNSTIKELKDKLKNTIYKNGSPYSDLEQKLNAIPQIHEINKDYSANKKILELKTFLDELSHSPMQLMTGPTFKQIGEPLLSIFAEYYDNLINNFPLVFEPPTYIKIYIPSLRGLRPIFSASAYSDLFRDRLIEDYFQKEEGFSIYTGLNLYDLIKRYLLGSLEKRDLIRHYEKFLSDTFFDGDTVTIIPYENPNRIFVKIGDEKEQPIHELGDGIQSIIIITLPLFLNKNASAIIFIDEPELNLHPGQQRKLLEILLEEKGFEKFQYFITTHSNHLLDIIIDYPDVSLYSIQKKLSSLENRSKEKIPAFFISPLMYGDTNALQLLGIRNSSVFLSNCTIWVEGITDRKYFRKYLDIYQSKVDENFQYKEDLHYSFVEYGGSNITHWSFLNEEPRPMNVERICSRLFLIADKPDKNSKKIEERHTKLKKLLKERFCELPCKEVENLLSPDVITRILIDYGERKEVIPSFNYEDYKNKPLGNFLNLILKDHTSRNYESGNTISDKGNFCDKAIKNIKQWDDLSPDAQSLTKDIAKFIKDNNMGSLYFKISPE